MVGGSIELTVADLAGGWQTGQSIHSLCYQTKFLVCGVRFKKFLSLARSLHAYRAARQVEPTQPKGRTVRPRPDGSGLEIRAAPWMVGRTGQAGAINKLFAVGPADRSLLKRRKAGHVCVREKEGQSRDRPPTTVRTRTADRQTAEIELRET